MEREVFMRSIASLDPLLSVRWGAYANQWVVERKAVISQEEIGYLARRYRRLGEWVGDDTRSDIERVRATYIGVAEELVSANQQRRVVFFTPHLDNRTYEQLCLSDIRRYGGYSRLADQMDEFEAGEMARLERALTEERLDINRETYDMLNFLWRKRAAALDHGQRDMNVLLHGKRRSAPVLETV